MVLRMERTMQEKSRVKLRIWITTILVFLVLGVLPAVKGVAAETQGEEKTAQILSEADVVEITAMS